MSRRARLRTEGLARSQGGAALLGVSGCWAAGLQLGARGSLLRVCWGRSPGQWLA